MPALPDAHRPIRAHSARRVTPGEARYRLGPLALPDPDNLAAAARAEAVTLFAERARSADRGFGLTGETTPAVARPQAAAGRWLDAEEAAMGQVLAWATGHDPPAAGRLAAALGWWWLLRGRLPGQNGLLREVAARAGAGSDGWCAVQLFVTWAALLSADQAGALEHATALRDVAADRGQSQALAEGLATRAAC